MEEPQDLLERQLIGDAKAAGSCDLCRVELPDADPAANVVPEDGLHERDARDEDEVGGGGPAHQQRRGAQRKAAARKAYTKRRDGEQQVQVVVAEPAVGRLPRRRRRHP